MSNYNITIDGATLPGFDAPFCGSITSVWVVASYCLRDLGQRATRRRDGGCTCRSCIRRHCRIHLRALPAFQAIRSLAGGVEWLGKCALAAGLERAAPGEHRAKSGSASQLKGRDRAAVVAMVVTGETVSVERFGRLHKLFLQIRAQALFFDYKSMTGAAGLSFQLRLS